MTDTKQPEALRLADESDNDEWIAGTKEVLGLNETSWSLSGVALQHVMDDARALEAKLKEKNGG
jgi:hypothetical protein